MIAVYRSPAPPLDVYVERICYWEGVAGPHRRERVLPNGRFQLIIDLADSFDCERPPERVTLRPAPPLVVGLQTRYAVLETAAMRVLMGAVLLPGGARGLFDVPADAFRDQVVPLDLVWGSEAFALRDRLREAPTIVMKLNLLEESLQQRAANRAALHPAVRYALGAFHEQPVMRRVAEVRREAGLSHLSVLGAVSRTGRVDAQALLPRRPVHASRTADRSRRAGRLGRCRAGLRLCRPGAPRERIPRFLRDDAGD